MKKSFKIPGWLSVTGRLVSEHEKHKRVFDVAFIILFSPLILSASVIVGLLIFIFAGWPIIFVQKRFGKHKQPFNMYKFRTMYNGAQAKGTWTEEEDERIINGCRFIRKARLDELPQFFNVLIGDMSIIGPRPSPNIFNHIAGGEEEFYFSVRRGITGLIQVENIMLATQEQYFRKDIDLTAVYVNNFSWKNEFTIILKTCQIMANLKGK